jgi:uncharacterized membrane protein YdbT with pleckstrin-like domain
MTTTYLQSLLGDGEKVLYTTRRHWMVLAASIFPEAALSVGLLVLVTLIMVLAPITFPWAGLGFFLLVLPLASLARDVLDWSNRQFVITTRRVIYLQGIINKDVTDSSLEKVNDVKLEQTGWGRLLNYGDVEILTASELGVNKFSAISDPINFKKAMLNAKHRLEADPGSDIRPAARPTGAAALMAQLEERQAGGSVPASADVPTLIEQLDRLRAQGVLTEAEFQEKKKQLLARL